MTLPFTFLLCSERSGSNLVTRIVDGHPAVCGPAPAHLFRYLLEHGARYGRLAHDAERARLATDLHDLFDAKVARWTTTLTADEARELVAHEAAGGTAGVVAALFEREAVHHGAAQVFVKENEVPAVVGPLLTALPDARFLHLVRDPREMAYSWKRARARRGGVVRAADQWLRDQTAFAALVAPMVGVRAASTTYEALVTDPQGALGGLLDLMGLAWDPSMLAFHEDPLVVANAEAAVDWGNTARPLMAGNTDKWRQGLDADEVAFVEARCGPVMRAFGYEPSHDDADVAALRAVLGPREPLDKPGYDDVSAEERGRRARSSAVIARLSSAPMG